MIRYLLLILLNLPIIVVSIITNVAKYKMNKMPRKNFLRRALFWSCAFIAVCAGFPVYNLLYNINPIFDTGLSLLEIILITCVIHLMFSIGSISIKVEENEKTMRELHQQLSIDLSKKN